MLLFSLACNSSKITANNTSNEKKTFTISGKVDQLFSYCGGARPTQRTLDDLSQPKPFADKIFYIKEGNINTKEGKVITSFTTKGDGSFSFQLPKGIYSIVVAEQLQSINVTDFQNKNLNVDQQCLQKWWKKPYHILEVKNQNISDLYFLFKHQCRIPYDIPCLTYIGPLPR